MIFATIRVNETETETSNTKNKFVEKTLQEWKNSRWIALKFETTLLKKSKKENRVIPGLIKTVGLQPSSF